MTTDRSVIAIEFDVDALPASAIPSACDRLAAAADLGADRLTVDARHTADGWVVLHPRDEVALPGRDDARIDELTFAELRGVSSLEEAVLAAHKRNMGLVIRVHDTHAIDGVSAALAIMGRDGPPALRRRYLVVVATQRIGKRLRQEAPDLPSGYHVRPDGRGPRGFISRRFANLSRAAADADDLVIDRALVTPERVRDKLAPLLAKRGSFVWITNVSPDEQPALEGLGAGGLIVRRRLPR